MRKFKNIIDIIDRTIGCFCFGFGIGNMFIGNYNISAYSLLITSILFITGYFIQQYE